MGYPTYIPNSNIEIYSRIKMSRKIKYAIFDHDGTISTLRQGWEKIMKKVMIEAIFDKNYRAILKNSSYKEVDISVSKYIDESTGIQTILQMEALVEMVKEFGYVPKERILDKFGYKKIYNKEILRIVNKRIADIKNGKLDAESFMIKGVKRFLELLNKNGVNLYLASGTDHEDAVNEARILGYSDYFNGGIFGAYDDLSKFSKKMIIESVINKNNLKGPELLVIGDGPVEMSECRRANGIAIGVASDEIKRSGINQKKRMRLIKSGAQIIIPDFTDADKLIEFLF